MVCFSLEGGEVWLRPEAEEAAAWPPALPRGARWVAVSCSLRGNLPHPPSLLCLANSFWSFKTQLPGPLPGKSSPASGVALRLISAITVTCNYLFACLFPRGCMRTGAVLGQRIPTLACGRSSICALWIHEWTKKRDT